MAFTAQTLTATVGTDGRVRNVDTQKILAGINKWELNEPVSILPYPHFESPTQANGTVKPLKLRSIGDTKFNLAGWYNSNVTDGTSVVASTDIVGGAYVTMDFFVSKTSSRGYPGVVGWIKDLDVTTDEQGICQFTCTLDVDGLLPVFGAIT